MTDFISSLPAAPWILLAIVILVLAAVVLYALHYKGDVFAEFSHGMTSFKLQAKERPRRRTSK